MLLLGFIFLIQINAQTLTASANRTDVLMGNYFVLTIKLENAKAKNFESPSFKNFNIVGGPNQSSSFSMMNGEVSQSLSYSYYLEPKDVGTFYIDPITVETDAGFLETSPIEINVSDNPDGIKQKDIRKDNEFNFDNRMDFDLFNFPGFERDIDPENEKKQPEKDGKKKRKIYRI